MQKFTCQICLKEFGQITGKHLKTHNINTVAEYLLQFPGAKTVRERKDSEETLQKKRDARKGYKHTQETKDKIGAGNLGKIMSPEATAKWKESYAKFLEENDHPMIGRDRGQAFKDHMSEVAKNRSPELVADKVRQMNEARRGSKATQEQRDNYSEGRLKYMIENPDKLNKKLFNIKPELEFEKKLQDIGTTYQKSFKLGKHLYDFLINNDVIVEIDGPYHWNKDLYGKKNDPDEMKLEGLEKTQIRDKKKTEYAISKGYQLYRIKVLSGLPDDWLTQLKAQQFSLF